MQLTFPNVNRRLILQLNKIDWKGEGYKALEPVSDALSAEGSAAHEFDSRSRVHAALSLTNLLICVPYLVMSDKEAAASVGMYALIAVTLVAWVRSWQAKRARDRAFSAAEAVIDDAVHSYPVTPTVPEDA